MGGSRRERGLMRFKTDENLHPDAALLLREHGHDASTVWDQSLRGRPDTEIAEACRREGRELVTMDLDFADIRTYPPEQFAGLIVLRLRDQSRAASLAGLRRILTLIEGTPVAGTLWVVDEATTRIWPDSSEA